MKNAVHQYEDKLLEFAYGELPRHEADAVDAHVRGCAKCTQALTEIRSVRTAMSTLPVEAAPDAGLESLLAFAEQAAKRNAQAAAVPFWKKYLTPLVAVMTVVLVGVFGFRASEEFDTSPAAAAADAKLSQTEDRRRAEPLATAEKKKVEEAEANAPAPVGAAAPSPADQAPARDEQEQAPDPELTNKLRGLEGKRAALPKGGAPAKVAPQSVTRRAMNNSSPLGDEELKQQNFSDVGLRGGKQARLEEERSRKTLAEPQKEAPPPPPAPAQTADKGASPFGLSGGGGLSSAQAPSVPQGGVLKDAAEARPSVPTAVPSESAASGYGSYDSAPVTRSKKSMSLGGPGRGSVSSEGDDSVALDKADVAGVDGDARLRERQRAESRARSLESARVSSNRGDRTSEIRFATEALTSGATGSERVEALKRLCDAWEALGEPARADPYCDALLREFPSSLAARSVADRRERTQRPSPAPARAKKSRAADLEADALEKNDGSEKVSPASTPAY